MAWCLYLLLSGTKPTRHILLRWWRVVPGTLRLPAVGPTLRPEKRSRSAGRLGAGRNRVCYGTVRPITLAG